MKCDNCGQIGDYLGQESSWRAVSQHGGPHSLYECEQCGNHQHISG